MVKEHKLKIEDIEGTGKEGRVLKEDVQRHAEAAKQTGSTPSVPASSTPAISQTQMEDRVQ
jgi:2-oxoisovalerate dehydrogenase E2 component (dihydrolipoyl transacylase)